MKKKQPSVLVALVGLVGALALGSLGQHGLAGQAGGVAQAAPASLAAFDRSLDEKLHSSVSGNLVLTVVKSDAEGAHVRAELRNPRFERTKGGGDLTQELARPFYFTMLSSGEMKDFFFARNTSSEARAQLKGMTTAMQMVSPSGTSASWQIGEQDVTGDYVADYTVQGGHVHKKKERFVRPPSLGKRSDPPPGSEFDVKGTVDFDIDKTGWPSKASGRDALDMTIGGLHSATHSATRAKLLAVESHPELIGVLHNGDYESETAGDEAAVARAHASADRNLIGGKTYAELAVDLASKDTRTRNQTQARLRALFRVSPEAVAQAQAAIMKGDLDVNARKRLAAALGQADTPEAQKALTSVLRSTEVSSIQKMDAAVALGQAKNPTPETQAAVREAMSSEDTIVSSTATLAEGSLIKTMNGKQQGDTQDGVQALIDGLNKATSDYGRILYLKALGNAGDPRVLDAIQPYLTQGSSGVRAAAVYSLRFIEGDVAAQFLIQAMGDEDVTVRGEAVHALAVRPLAPFAGMLETFMKAEPEEAVRRTLLGSLQMRLGQEADAALARDIITWASTSDPSETVRNYAKDLLGEETRPRKIVNVNPDF
jgi:hypothetical protein